MKYLFNYDVENHIFFFQKRDYNIVCSYSERVRDKLFSTSLGTSIVINTLRESHVQLFYDTCAHTRT